MNHQLSVGTILAGKYCISQVLGEGGFGITYLAQDLYLKEKVAIKELFLFGFSRREGKEVCYPDQSESEREYFAKNRERFLNEARILAKLSGKVQEGVVQIHAYFEENRTAYIVMEYLKGQSLKEVLQERKAPISEKELLFWMHPVLSSLEKIHRTGIYHRDISPDNLMLLVDGRMKIVDFGGARNIYLENITRMITVKRGYTPPEQYEESGEIGPWTDVYALCATMYHCLTGKLPLDPFIRKKQALQTPRQLGVSLSSSVEKALMRGLEIKKEKRWQTMRELEEALYGGKNFERQIAWLPGTVGILALSITFSKIELSQNQEYQAPLPQEVTEVRELRQLPTYEGEEVSLPDGEYRFFSYANPEKALTLLYDEEGNCLRLALLHRDEEDSRQIFTIVSGMRGETYFRSRENGRHSYYLSLDMKNLSMIATERMRGSAFFLQYEGFGTLSVHDVNGWYWILPERLLYESTDGLFVDVSIDREESQWEERTKWLYEIIR